jgi:ribosomal protein L37AE/L43A
MRDHIVLPRCTVQLAHGEFCDADAAEDMPFPICERHADQLYQRMQQDPARLPGIPCPECDRLSLQRLGADVTCRACNATISPDRFQLWSDAVTEEALSNATKARQQSVVYYVREAPEIIKIGTTINLINRLSALRVDHDALLATEPGGRSLEQMRHKQFAHVSLGKWERFRSEPDLLDHIAMLRKHFGDPKVS